MGNWNEGDICEEHDSPDECEESCFMDLWEETDNEDIVCGIHLFSGTCDESCKEYVEDNEPETAHILSMMGEAYATGTIRS